TGPTVGCGPIWYEPPWWNLGPVENRCNRPAPDSPEPQIGDHCRRPPYGVDQNFHPVPGFETPRETDREAGRGAARRELRRCDRISQHLELGRVDPVATQQGCERRRDREDALAQLVDSRLGFSRNLRIGE